jgi:hypothetical protein
MFGPKKRDVNGTREDAPQNISIIHGIKYRIKRTEYVARLVQIRNANKFFVVKHEGNRRLGRTKRRGGDNIKVDITEI